MILIYRWFYCALSHPFLSLTKAQIHIQLLKFVSKLNISITNILLLRPVVRKEMNLKKISCDYILFFRRRVKIFNERYIDNNVLGNKDNNIRGEATKKSVFFLPNFKNFLLHLRTN